jgi:hypothetical protein
MLVARDSSLEPYVIRSAISWAISWARKLRPREQNLVSYLNQEVKWWALKGSNLRPLPCEGKRNPSLLVMTRIADALSVSLAKLVSE